MYVPSTHQKKYQPVKSRRSISIIKYCTAAEDAVIN
jgi:hypothetical protein